MSAHTVATCDLALHERTTFDQGVGIGFVRFSTGSHDLLGADTTDLSLYGPLSATAPVLHMSVRPDEDAIVFRAAGDIAEARVALSSAFRRKDVQVLVALEHDLISVVIDQVPAYTCRKRVRTDVSGVEYACAGSRSAFASHIGVEFMKRDYGL